LDSKLNLEGHIVKICGEIYTTLCRLRINCKYMSTEVRRRLVVSLLIPKFIYCAPIIIGASKTAMHRLNVAYNSCARFVYCVNRFDHISQFSKKIINCSLPNFLKHCICVFIFKLLLFKQPLYLYEKLNFMKSNRSYYDNYLVIPRYHSSFRERSFWIEGLRIWNSLSSDIRNSSTLSAFRTGSFAYFSNQT
jgi:hypothetical protein